MVYNFIGWASPLPLTNYALGSPFPFRKIHFSPYWQRVYFVKGYSKHLLNVSHALQRSWNTPKHHHDHELIQLFMEDRVHEACECWWGITQPKWHHQKFIQAILHPHNNLLNVFIYYANLIVMKLDINLARVLTPIELIQQIVDARHMIIILYGYFVQSMVINAHSQIAIFFYQQIRLVPHKGTCFP